MKIGVIGASGKAGGFIVKEALERGHAVTAIVRNSAKLKDKSAAILEKDIFDLKADDLKAFDVVVNAFGPAPGQEHQHGDAGQTLIAALKATSNTRLIVVGGAGTLFVDEAKKTRLLDTPNFPKEYYATASEQGKNLQALENSSGLNWTFISPAAFFNPEGQRTGTYQKGKDNLIVNAKGESYVSYADYAVAVLDEIENPQHMNERFTLVSEA